MSTRLDVIQFKKTKNDKTFAVKLGTATPNKNGDGFNIYLDAMPASVNGQFQFSIVPQRERRQPGEDDLNDEIPYGQ